MLGLGLKVDQVVLGSVWLRLVGWLAGSRALHRQERPPADKAGLVPVGKFREKLLCDGRKAHNGMSGLKIKQLAFGKVSGPRFWRSFLNALPSVDIWEISIVTCLASRQSGNPVVSSAEPFQTSSKCGC